MKADEKDIQPSMGRQGTSLDGRQGTTLDDMFDRLENEMKQEADVEDREKGHDIPVLTNTNSQEEYMKNSVSVPTILKGQHEFKEGSALYDEIIQNPTLTTIVSPLYQRKEEYRKHKEAKEEEELAIQSGYKAIKEFVEIEEIKKFKEQQEQMDKTQQGMQITHNHSLAQGLTYTERELPPDMPPPPSMNEFLPLLTQFQEKNKEFESNFVSGYDGEPGTSFY
jgi:hypothetical protein